MSKKPTYEELEQKVEALEKQIAELRNDLGKYQRDSLRYETLLNQAPVGVWHAARDGSGEYLNKKLAEISGLTMESASGAGWASRLHPDDRDRVFKEWTDFVEGKAPYHSTYRFIDDDGESRWVIGQANPVHGDNGKVFEYIGTLTDITRQKAAEEALIELNEMLENEIKKRTAKLRESEERYRLLIANMPDSAVMLFDRDLRYLVADGPALSAQGFSGEKMIGRTLSEVLPDHSPGLDVFYKKILDGETPRFDSRHGGHRYQVFGVPIRNDIGEVVAGMVLSRDVTERVRAEEALRESEERLRHVVENMPVMMDALGEGYTLIVWNRECERVTGYKAGEIVHNPLALETLYPDAEYRAQVAESFNLDSDFRDREFTLTAKDGKEKTISWSNISISCPIPGWRSWAVGVDVTERKQVEEALECAKTAAEIASQTKSEFLANMSHEIRTPINAMLGFLQILQKHHLGPLNRRQNEYLNHIISSSNRLSFLIDDILDLSRIEAGKIKISRAPFNLKKLMERLTHALSGLAGEKRLSLHVRLSPDAPEYLTGDEHRIEQVLRNLTGNAMKFTERGRVEVSVQKQARDKLLFKVNDTGIGIPKDKQESLFDKFYQVDSSYTKRYSGAGLGLAISRELVELMGGEIGFESEVGKGSCFHFTLDLEAPGKEPVAPEPEPSTAAQAKFPERRLNILLAEDDALNRKSMTWFLKRDGHAITQVKDGREVLKALEAGNFDIILMDVQMPEMDGLEATRRIRRSTSGKFDPDTPIIALTAYAMQGDRETFLQAGMNDYVSKPVDFDLLSEKMTNLCEG